MKLNRHEQGLNYVRFFVDMFNIALCWVLAYIVRFQSGFIAIPKGEETFENFVTLLPQLCFSYGIIFIALGLYRRSLVKRRIWEEHFDIARTHVVAFFVFVTSVYFLYEHRFSRIAFGLFFAFAPFVLPIGRSVIRKFNRIYLHAKKQRRNAIVVGTGLLANEISELVNHRLEWNLSLFARYAPSQMSELHEVLVKHDIATVFVALNPSEMPQLQNIYSGIGNTVAEVYLFPDLGLPAFLVPKVVHIEKYSAIALNVSNLDGYGRFAKRVYDIAFSSLFLLAFSPVYLICAALVKISSPGPIFYRQERMGLDGRTFQCLKFRGMYVDAESKTGPVWATANDERTTPIGRWLRRTSLDEIPQFINVLKGEMSVVGPRPERPVFVSNFREQIPGYMLRHQVKAGLTGWAQINGWRGNTSLEKRIECDLWYIQNWSLWLDLKICLLTPLRGFIHPNAY